MDPSNVVQNIHTTNEQSETQKKAIAIMENQCCRCIELYSTFWECFNNRCNTARDV